MKTIILSLLLSALPFDGMLITDDGTMELPFGRCFAHEPIALTAAGLHISAIDCRETLFSNGFEHE